MCDSAVLTVHAHSEASAPSFYAFGVVLLQLLTEQGPLGLLSAVRESMEGGTLLNLVPRLPANNDMQVRVFEQILELPCQYAATNSILLTWYKICFADRGFAGMLVLSQVWASSYCSLALRCTQPGGISNLESELLPELEELFTRLGKLGSKSMSWEQVRW